ncbi:MAG: permease-like cell division protein FtsX [Candidatus Aminicenantes bacterium]|jgi:cell division transport system permease protein
MLIIFFLEKDIPEEQRISVEKRLKESSLVNNVRYVSAEQALVRFRQNFPELQGVIENIKINPFPASFETNLAEENLSPETISRFIQVMKNMDGIEDAQFNRDWVERMESLSRLAQAIGLFLGGILALASFFIISNVIRLNVFARRDEIEILRLVGGTNLFIRVPFILEGVILGILGGAVSLALLFLLVKFFPLYLGASLGALNDIINFRYLSLSQISLLIAGGAIIGFLGSLSSLARFLKV